MTLPLLAHEEIARYRPLIRNRARSYWRGYLATKVTLEELEEIATVAVWESTRRYRPDHEREAKFGTYVTLMVNRALSREKTFWLKGMRLGSTVSLSPGPDGEEAVTLTSDYLPASEIVDAARRRQLIREAVDALKPRQKEIIERRFWRDETQVEIGAELGLTRQRIQQIEVAAYDQMRPRLRHLWMGAMNG